MQEPDNARFPHAHCRGNFWRVTRHYLQAKGRLGLTLRRNSVDVTCRTVRRFVGLARVLSRRVGCKWM